MAHNLKTLSLNLTPLWPCVDMSRRPLAPLGKITAATLIAIAGMMVFAMAVLAGKFDLAGAFVVVVALGSAGIVASGRRWAPLLGPAVGGAVAVGAAPIIVYTLSHPSETHHFAFWIIFLAVLLIASVAGIGSTLENYRRGAFPMRAPLWMAGALIGLVGLCLGAIGVAMIPEASAASSMSAEALSELPAVTAAGFTFDQTQIHAKVGEVVALRLENTDAGAPHSFDIDAFNIHVPMPRGESALALFKATRAGSFTFYCGVPGHGDLMQGTLIVTPQ